MSLAPAPEGDPLNVFTTVLYYMLAASPPSLPLTMDDDHLDDSFSDFESDIFSTRSAASSATSHDVSMRSGSPAPSVYSVTSSLRAASYRQEYGRGLNNYSEVYRLPADDEELDRLGTAFVNLSPKMSLADSCRHAA